MKKAFQLREAWRVHSRLHCGLILGTPIFWSSFALFIHPGFGGIGFLLHAWLTLPRTKLRQILYLGAFPLWALFVAIQYPFLTLPGMPWHQEIPSQGFGIWTGTVSNFPLRTAQGGYSFPLETSTGRFRVLLPPPIAPPALGSTLQLAAILKKVTPPDNPGQPDPRWILRSQGALAHLEGTAYNEIRPPPAWKILLAKLREFLGQQLENNVPQSSLPLIAATLLNDTEKISPETQQAFLRSGMQHIVAISGQHIGLLITFLLFGGLAFRIPRKMVYFLAGILTFIYIPVTCSPVSVVRSGIMLALTLPSIFQERPSSGLHTLCLTASLDLILDPYNILNLGFQLSYIATLALILFSRPSRMVVQGLGIKNAFLSALAQMVFLSVMVFIFTYLPLSVSTHISAPWGILGNLITVPLSSLMLIASLCSWTFSLLPFCGVLANWSGACAGLSSLILEGSVFYISQLPGAIWPITQSSTFWLALFGIFGIVLAMVFRSETPRWRLGLALTGVLFLAEIIRPSLSSPTLIGPRVTFLAVGHGDAAVLELPGSVILIDAGPSTQVAKRVILPFLRSRGIRKIDALVLTHPDRDHYGGAFGLLGDIPISQVLVSSSIVSNSSTWNCLRETAQALKTPWIGIQAGDRIYQRGKLRLWTLGPDSTLKGLADNERSVVLLLISPQKRILFTGDIEGAGQRALASSWNLWRGSSLKVPHHASDRTTLPCFLKAVNPPEAIISSGLRPGFPGLKTLEVLKSIQTKTKITQTDGATIWKWGPS